MAKKSWRHSITVQLDWKKGNNTQKQAKKTVNSWFRNIQSGVYEQVINSLL